MRAVLPRALCPCTRVSARPPAGAAAPADDLANVLPKKQDFDLKRDVEPKLEKLERRTQRALVALLSKQQEPQQQGDDATPVAAQ